MTEMVIELFRVSSFDLPMAIFWAQLEYQLHLLCFVWNVWGWINLAILLLDESKIGFVLLAWLTLACIVCEIVHRNFPISNKYLWGNYKIGNLSPGPGPGSADHPKCIQGITMGRDRGRGHRGDNAWSQLGHNEPILHITHSMRAAIWQLNGWEM